MATVSTSCNWSDYESTSSTSFTLSNAATTSVSFTIETGKAWVAGDEIACIPTAAKIPMMCIGTVTSYNSGTGALVVSINRFESNIPSWDLVSGSTNTVGTGAKTFLTYNGKSALLAAADNIMVARQSTNGANRFVGTVTSYNNSDGTLVMNCTSTIGSGTSLTDWVIVSGGTFTAWDFTPAPTSTYTVAGGVTLTFNSQPKYPLPTLSSTSTGIIDFQNSSTTTLRTFHFGRRDRSLQFTNNGHFKTTVSDWITLFTGDGTASQTKALTGSGLDAINVLPGVWVETGSGTGVYKFWPIYHSSSSAYGGSLSGNYMRRYGVVLTNFGKDDCGNVGLYTVADRKVTFGDGTNGNVIPNGAKVRIPNIHFDAEMNRSCLSTAITSGQTPTFAVNVGKSGNLSNGGGQLFTINQEEFTATITGNSMSITARAQNSTSAANHAQGDTVFWVNGATTTTTNNRMLVDFNAGGKATISKCIFGGGIYFYGSNYQALNITDCMFTAMQLTSTTGTTTVNGIYATVPPVTDAGSAVQVLSTQGSCSMQNMYGATTHIATNASASGVSIQSNQAVSLCQNITGVAAPSRNGTSSSSVITMVTNVFDTDVYMKNFTVIGGRLNLQNMSLIELDGFVSSDQCSGTGSATAPVYAVICQNVKGLVFRNMTKAVSAGSARTGLISTDSNCKDIVFHTITYDHNNFTSTSSLLGNNIRLVNCNFGTMRDGAGSIGDNITTGASTAADINIQNVYCALPSTYADANGNGTSTRAFYEYVSGHSTVWRTTGFNTNFAEYGPFHVLLDDGTKATGTLHMAVGAKVTRDILDFTGTAYHGNNGYIYLPTINDTVIIKSYHPLRSITGFSATAVDPEDVNSGNLTYEFELQNYEGTFTGTWTSLTAANLDTAFDALTGYDSNVGLAIRIRVTATASSATNAVINIRMFTTNDSSFNPPIGKVDYTITGVDTDSTLAAFDGSTEVDYETGVSGTRVLQIPYEYDGLDKSHSIKIRCYDCTWDDHTWTHRQFAVTYPSGQVADTEITEATKATVAAYTSLGTCAKVYDYAKYYGTLRANLLKDMPMTKSGNALDFGSNNVVIDKTAVSVFSISGSTVTIKADYVDTGSITTTGTITLSNGATTGTAVLSGSNGNSGLLTLTVPAGSSVVVNDDNDTRKLYDASSSGTESVIIPFGSSGTWSYKVAQYGYDSFSGTVVVTPGGAFSAIVSLEVDSNVVDTVGNVAAYTTLETCQKIYDYSHYFETLTNGIDYDLAVDKTGTALELGSRNLTVNSAAGSVWSYAGAGITIKANNIAQSAAITSVQTTGTITLSGASVAGTAPLSGSNGKSAYLTLSGLTSCSVYVETNTTTQHDYQTGITGSYNSVIPFGSTGTWTWVAKRLGYFHQLGTFNAASGGFVEVTPAFSKKQNPDGSDMYQGTTSALVDIEYNGTTQANIDIADGTATLQATFDETEASLSTADGMAWLASGKSGCTQFNSAGGDYLFMSTGWRLRRNAIGDANATLEAFAVSADGTVVDDVNGSVQFLTSDSPTAIAQAVLTALNATQIPVNVKYVNDIQVGGTGTESDPWNPV